MNFMKDNWKTTQKTYYAVVRGNMKKKQDTISSYLVEDENYVVSSTTDKERGKLAETEYVVMKEDKQVSLLKINLLTGKKNQIRVHMAEAGHPIVGDAKYGKEKGVRPHLLLHSYSIEFNHPFSKKRITIKADVPDYFKRAVDYTFSD